MIKNALELFKSVDTNPIHGTTVIDHRARYKLKLTCDEYVVIDLIHKLMIKKKPFNYTRLRNHIGIDLLKDDNKENYKFFSAIMKSLKDKGLYEKRKDLKDKTQFYVTKKYQAIHKIELDDNYEEFWNSSGNRTWHGSKAAGKILYKRVVEKYGSEYINSQKTKYFWYLNLEGMGWKTILNITTFLNFEKGRYNEAWEKYGEEHIKKETRNDRPETANTVTTKEDADEKFK